MDSPASSTQYLDRADGRIAYDRIGSGPLLVLAPGMGDIRQTFRHLAPLLADAGYSVVTTDLRGHGESTAAFRSYGDSETADDLAALIEHLGGPAVVVGNSMSSAAGVILAARRPELVSGLVLLGPFVRDPAQSALARIAFRVMLAPAWISPVWNAYLPSLYAGRRPADFDDHRRAIGDALKRPGHRRAFSITAGISHADAESMLDQVRTPALVVMGEKDPDFPDPRAEAQWISEQLDGSVEMVPEAGHYPQSQAPAEVADAIVRFLTSASHRA
jgi:pimeloyl-ACP methyl ester carboxylesterase